MEQVFKVGFINSTQQLIDCALSAAAKLNINMATSLAGLDAAVPPGLRDGAGGSRGHHQPSRYLDYGDFLNGFVCGRCKDCSQEYL